MARLPCAAALILACGAIPGPAGREDGAARADGGPGGRQEAPDASPGRPDAPIAPPDGPPAPDLPPPACGALGASCCAGLCAGGGACLFDRCVMCGLDGQPCCAGGVCAGAGLRCYTGAAPGCWRD